MTGRKRNPEQASVLRQKLLHWYDRNRRDLPWRRTRDPYAIWVSEIMLQQTRVAAVIEKYESFLRRFPAVADLARAAEQDVLAQWSGLGYYRRARMLHKAAEVVADKLGGVVPTTAVELRNLPGIGAYTAAAIASIAHGEHVAVVDGNVERVLCRLEGWEAKDSAEQAALRPRIEALAAQLVDSGRPGDFNQAMMELGATVCTPRSPQCLTCPFVSDCKTRGEHKMPSRPRMSSREVACALVVRGANRREVLLEQRPASDTVMPGMWQLPFLREEDVSGRKVVLTVRHAIMLVNYVVRVCSVAEDELRELESSSAGERRWVSLDEADAMALTVLARKALTRSGLNSAPADRTRAIAQEPIANVV
jgi:A/G-specific adenine glycosylase